MIAAQNFTAVTDTVSGMLRKAVQQMRAILSANGERERTQRDALTAFSVRVASAGLLYLSQIVMARWIGAHDYGVYVFVWTWVLVLGGLSHLGFSVVMIRLVPEYREKGRWNELRGLVKGGRWFALFAGSAVAALGMVGLYVYGDMLSSEYVLPAYLALVCVPLYALTDVQDGIGRARGWMWIGLLPPYVLRPLMVLGAMGAAFAMGFPLSATTAVAAAIVATWGAGLIQTLLVNREFNAEVPRGAKSYKFSGWLKVSLPLVIIATAELVLQNADILVVSRYMTPADVGIYFASAKTMSLILFVHYAVGSAVANRFSALNARGDREKLKAFVRDAANWTFWPSLVGAIAILIAGKPLLWLFGPDFQSGYPVMFVLVLGFLVRAAMGPVEFLLNMLGEQKICAMVLVVTAVLDIALNFALVPAFGLMGAAVATSLSLMTAALMNYMVASSRLDIDIAIWRNLPGRKNLSA